MRMCATSPTVCGWQKRFPDGSPHGDRDLLRDDERIERDVVRIAQHQLKAIAISSLAISKSWLRNIGFPKYADDTVGATIQEHTRDGEANARRRSSYYRRLPGK